MRISDWSSDVCSSDLSAENTSQLSGESQSYVDDAKQAFDTSRDNFTAYKKLMKDRKGEAYAKVEESYDAMQDEGIETLFRLLSTGDTDGYNAFPSVTPNETEKASGGIKELKTS